MIEQYFVVDNNTPFLASTPRELDGRVKHLLDKNVTISRHPLGYTDAVDRYIVSGTDFTAVVHAYPQGWDIHTPLGSDRKMIRIVFLEGDYKQFYGRLIEALGVFDNVVDELNSLYEVNTRVLPIFDFGRNLAAILLDAEPHTPFRVHPTGGSNSLPAYGVFVRNSREMSMFRKALRTSSPSGKLLDMIVQQIH